MPRLVVILVPLDYWFLSGAVVNELLERRIAAGVDGDGEVVIRLLE